VAFYTSLKSTLTGLQFCRRQIDVHTSFAYASLASKSAKSREIPRKYELTAVHGHPRSSILSTGTAVSRFPLRQLGFLWPLLRWNMVRFRSSFSNLAIMLNNVLNARWITAISLQTWTNVLAACSKFKYKIGIVLNYRLNCSGLSIWTLAAVLRVKRRIACCWLCYWWLMRRTLVDRANDWLRENNDVEVKSCETVTWISHDAASLSAGSELMVLSKPVAPPVVNSHCYRGLRYENVMSLNRDRALLITRTSRTLDSLWQH